MAHSSSDTAFITLEKSFTYRGGREHWANTYHLDQVPGSAGVWDTLAAQIWNLEKLFLTADVQFERLYGHTPGTPPILVHEADQAPAGEGGPAGAFVPTVAQHPTPGDAAMWVRWGTTQKSVLGKPIYLRNYYHAACWETNVDQLAGGQIAELQNLGNAFVAGLSVSGVTFRRAGPRGAVAQNSSVGPFITTRTLKSRGKRRKSLPTNPAGYSWKLIPSELTIN